MPAHVDDPGVCLLCGMQTHIGEPLIRSPAFLTRRDPLWRYAGRAMHADCFSTWSRREEFVRKFNTVMRGDAIMNDSGEIMGL